MTSGSFFADLTSFLGRIEEEGMAMREALCSSASGDSSSLKSSLNAFDEQVLGRGKIDDQLTKRSASVIERALAKKEDTRREIILEAAGLEEGLNATEEAVSELSSQREATRACLDLLEFNEGALNDLQERLMAYGYNRQPVNISLKQNSDGSEEGHSSVVNEDVQKCDEQHEQQQSQSHSIILDEQQCSIISQEGEEGGDGSGMKTNAVVGGNEMMIVQGECDEGSEAGEGEPQTPTLSEWAVSRHTRSMLKTAWGNGGECNPSVPVRSLRSLVLTERIATPMPNKDASHDLEFTPAEYNNQPYSNQENDSSHLDSDPPTPLAIDIELKTTSLQKELKGNRLSTETNSTNSSSTPASKIIRELSPMKTPHHRCMLENSIVAPNTSDTQNSAMDGDETISYLRASLTVSDSIDPFSTPSTNRYALQGVSSAANLPETRSCCTTTPYNSTTDRMATTPFLQDHFYRHPGKTADVDDAATPEMPSPPKVSVMSVEDLEKLASASCPLKKVVDSVSEEEYASAPKFLTLQVTHGALNSMVEKLNQYTAIHPSADEWLLSADEMVQVMNGEAIECDGDGGSANNSKTVVYDEKYCKTVLLSLIHLKRLQMRGGGIIRYAMPLHILPNGTMQVPNISGSVAIFGGGVWMLGFLMLLYFSSRAYSSHWSITAL